MKAESIPSMHDWVLVSIRLDWAEGRGVLQLIEYGTGEHREVVANCVHELQVPRAFDWGPSTSINGCSGPTHTHADLLELTVEMQSGDEIVICAEEFQLV